MSDEIRIEFEPGGYRVNVPVGTGLLSAARQAGAPIEAPCDGRGVCGKCRVHVPAESLAALDGLDVQATEGEKVSVLACLAQARASVRVEIPKEQNRGMAIVAHGVATSRTLEPHIRIERTSDTAVVWAGEEVLAMEATDVSNLGLAVDVGTTTLVAALVDLDSGAELAVASALNPQTVYGHDVLSRIRYGGEATGLETLQRALVSELNSLTGEVCERAGRNRRHVHEVVLAGNPCMLHLAVAQDPSPLGRTPYVSALRGDRSFAARELGLDVAPHGRVYLPGWISGFVGADITAGILATDLHKASKTTLFIDIGTNGEMVLAHGGSLWATSTAAGPAFEGVNIACGMRAAPGAIDAVRSTAAGGWQIHTIATAPAAGICGSGLLDLVATLVRTGTIAKSGRFDAKVSPPIGTWNERLGSRAIDLSDGVFVTQKDVRQVQLAKAAIRAGIDVLLARAGASEAEVYSVLVAGSFGYHVSPDSLGGSGLLPARLARRVVAVGNTSKTGAVLLLTSTSARREVARLSERAHAIDLADDAGFERRFVGEMSFGEVNPCL